MLNTYCTSLLMFPFLCSQAKHFMVFPVTLINITANLSKVPKASEPGRVITQTCIHTHHSDLGPMRVCVRRHIHTHTGLRVTIAPGFFSQV